VPDFIELTLGTGSPDTARVDLDAVVQLCRDLLERIHARVRGEHAIEDTSYNIVALKLFGYSLNTFKSIYYLLPHTVYEQAFVLLRTLWETGVNLDWIAREPEARAERFLRFTAVEYARVLEAKIRTARRASDHDSLLLHTRELAELERILHQQLAEFVITDRKGRKRRRDRFAAPTLRDVVNEVGGDWLEEYDLHYRMGSEHTHGAPAAVLFPIHDTVDHRVDRVRSIERSAIVGVLAIKVMSRAYKRWLAVMGESDEDFLRDLEHRSVTRLLPMAPR